jgi:hypothetical protein
MESSPRLRVSVLKNYPRSPAVLAPVAAGQRSILLWGVHPIHFSAFKGYCFHGDDLQAVHKTKAKIRYFDHTDGARTRKWLAEA